MEREALKLALEALDMERLHYLAHESGNDAPKYILEAIASCEQALAQPAQEPVCPACKAEVLYECVACSSNNYPPKPAQEPFGYLSIGGNPIFQKEKPEIGRWETLYTTPTQRPWVEPTGNEWFEWWRVSKVANETEAEIDFADFLIIAQAVTDKLKDDNK